MRYGKVLVEQVLKDGTIVERYDTSLSTSEIRTVLMKYFPGLKRSENSPNYFIGTYEGVKYAIRCKNVTYLGNPHPLFKKRIQIAEDLYTFYNEVTALGAIPLLMGVYSCDDNIIFVNFGIDTYIEKKAHNSSAHIYTSDLSAATTDGYFQKVDYFGNVVTAFNTDAIKVFLDETLLQSDEIKFSAENYYGEKHLASKEFAEPITPGYTLVSDIGEDNIDIFESDVYKEKSQKHLQSYLKIFRESIAPEFKSFFGGEDKNWHGIQCYQEMISNDYKNKYQPEWVGFFLEYRFEKYIDSNELSGLITYHQDKKDGGIDLDLYFPTIDSYGDLKAHSEESRGIQGNDWETVFSILNKKDETSHIYYVVCEHATEKDSEHDYEVTHFWNTQQGKSDLMSYHKRMKNNVTLKKFYILDINNDNKEYLTMFKQGINSNGKPRAPKIMIEQDNLHHFIIEEMNL